MRTAKARGVSVYHRFPAAEGLNPHPAWMNTIGLIQYCPRSGLVFRNRQQRAVNNLLMEQHFTSRMEVCVVLFLACLHGRRPSDDMLVDWSVGCLMGRSIRQTQKGQFVPTAGEGNRPSRLRMANEIQCILPYATR